MKKTGKYRDILKDVLKKQIQGLLEQLYEDAGVDSLLITNDEDLVNMGTGRGKMFLLQWQNLSQDFTSFCLKASEENPVITMRQDAYRTETIKKPNDCQGSTRQDRKSVENLQHNLKEESNDELNTTGSEQMDIADWQSAVLDMPDGSKQCSLCGYATAYSSNLKRHLYVKHHIGERKAPVSQFRCNYCRYATTVKCNMQRHVRKVHAIPVNSDTVEGHAGIAFFNTEDAYMTQGDFDASLNDSSTGATDMESEQKVQNVRKSRKRQHPDSYIDGSEVGNDTSSVEAKSEIKIKQQKTSEIAGIECIYCHLCFAETALLKQHIDEVHFGSSESGFSCEYCSKQFKTEFRYRGHLASHVNALQCSCGCSFTSNWQLKKHRKGCKIAKDGTEMQKNRNESSEIAEDADSGDDSLDELNSVNSEDHDNLGGENDVTKHTNDSEDNIAIKNISKVQIIDVKSLKDQIIKETCKELEIAESKEVHKSKITVFNEKM